MVKVIVDYCGLLYVVACSRVIKTDLEMAVLRYANKISSDAHKKARHIIIIYLFIIYLLCESYSYIHKKRRNKTNIKEKGRVKSANVLTTNACAKCLVVT